MGDKVMVQYIVRTQSEIQWAWGPVSSYHLNLNGIDSVGETGNDVMELVAMLDAGESTKEMLLDGFMDGLLHKLFLQKYRKCRAAHFTMRFVDLVFLACVFILAVWMKQDPAEVLGVSDRYALDNYLPLIGLITIAPLLEEDLRCSLRWWQIARSGPRDEGSKLLLRERGLLGRLILFCMDFGMLVRWMQSHAMWTKMLGWMVAAFAFVWTMQLKRRAESEWDPSLVTPSDRTDSLCIPLSFVCYIQTQSFFMSILFPFERIGVLYKTVRDARAPRPRPTPEDCGRAPRPRPTPAPTILPSPRRACVRARRCSRCWRRTSSRGSCSSSSFCSTTASP